MPRPRPDSVIALAPALARRQARARVGQAREQVGHLPDPKAPDAHPPHAPPPLAPSPGVGRIPLGFAREEAWLGGGLAAAGLHEAWAATPADAPAALAFALLLAELNRRQAERQTGAHPPPLLWLREDKAGTRDHPHAPGLAMLGIDPNAITLLTLPDPRAVLRAGLDCLREEGTGASVLIELAGRQPLLDLTASRRLALAAQANGALALLLRQDAAVAPSAAHSRWQVAAATSSPPIGAGTGSGAGFGRAPGQPAFALTLLRQRGGRDGLHLFLEWNCDTASFHERGADIIQPARPHLDGQAPLFGAGLAMVAGAAGAARRAGVG